MATIRLKEFPAFAMRIPELNEFVASTSNTVVAIGVESHGTNGSLMANQQRYFFTR
jgi:hypothetical protein